MIEKFKKSKDKEEDFTKAELIEIADKVKADYNKTDKKAVIINEINEKLSNKKPPEGDAIKLMKDARKLTDEYCENLEKIEDILFKMGRRAWSSRVKKVKSDLIRKSKRGLKV